MKRKILILAGLVFLGGCALKPKMIVNDYAPPRSIAILPMANETNDMKGPEYVRKQLTDRLVKRGYVVTPDAKTTDEILRTKLGITDGGQMGATTPQKLAEALGVDAVVYGDLMKFKFQNIGFYQNREVEASFKMVDHSGRSLWEDQRRSSVKQLVLSPKEAGKAMARGLAEKAVENMVGIPLWEEVQAVTKMVASTLPKVR